MLPASQIQIMREPSPAPPEGLRVRTGAAVSLPGGARPVFLSVAHRSPPQAAPRLNVLHLDHCLQAPSSCDPSVRTDLLHPSDPPVCRAAIRRKRGNQ